MSDAFWLGLGVMVLLMLGATLLLPEQMVAERPLEREPTGVLPVEEYPEESAAESSDFSEVPVVPVTAPRVAVDGVVDGGEYRHRTDADGFEVFWSNDADTLRVALVSPGSGYVAIGFDPEHRMQGANFIIAAVRGGRLSIRDDYGNESVSHASDLLLGGTDDILEAAGQERGGQTTVEFVIPLASRDPYDKRLIPGETYPIVVAYHETSDSFAARHSRRGAGTIRLDAAG